MVLAPLNLGTYIVNEHEMSGWEFVRRGGMLLLLAIILVSTLIARDLHVGRARVRVILLSLWAAGLLAFRPSLPDATLVLAEYLGLGALAYWYLYRKESSRAYFGGVASAES